MTDMRTPLGKVRGLGSAKEGTQHFWRQRMTAVANVPLIIFFVFLVISFNGEDYAGVVATMSDPLVAVVMLLVICSGIFHMHLGMQVVIEDYIHNEGAKLLALMVNTFVASLFGLMCVYSILKIGFGG